MSKDKNETPGMSGEEDAAFNNFIKSLAEAKDKFKEMNPDQLKSMVEILMQISAAYMMPLFYSLSCENGIESLFINDDNGDKFLLSFRKEGREMGSILQAATPAATDSKSDAVEFAEWIDNYEFFRLENGMWDSGAVWPFSAPMDATTEQLYEKFKQQNP